MQIFNLEIFGSDKEEWLSQSVEWKVEWIRKYTNQDNDAIIEEFVNNPKISKDKICLTCGDKMNFKIEQATKIVEIIDEQKNLVLDSIVKPKSKSRKK